MAPEATVRSDQNNDVPRLENLTLSQRAHTFLRDEILSNRLPPGTDLQDKLDNFFKRCIRDMRHVPTAETHVVAHAVLRNTVQGVVEGIDA